MPRCTIVGTAFGALTNAQGYYFINNVPAGVGRRSGRRSSATSRRESPASRVLAGQTITQDFSSKPPPVEVERDHGRSRRERRWSRATRSPRSSASTATSPSKLPVDRVSNVLALQPGVVASTNGNTLSIRGGRTDEAATYIDGVPTGPGNRGTGFRAPAAADAVTASAPTASKKPR